MGDNKRGQREDRLSKDAVNLCSQSAYPGDDELEALEREIMAKWKLDQPPDVQGKPSRDSEAARENLELDQPPDVQGKPSRDSEAARENLELARSALRAGGKQCDALGYIDLALETDIVNAALWLQRATVLIAVGDLREAFRSCGALEPADRTADIWKMGGKPSTKYRLCSAC